MLVHIHCVSCGKVKRKPEALRVRFSPTPGQWVWFVAGKAATACTCAQCGVRISIGDRCQAMTRYTDELGYQPWEHDFLYDTEPGFSGREQEMSHPEPGMGSYAVLLVRDTKRGLGAKVHGLNLNEIWGETYVGVLRQVHEQVEAYNAALKQEGQSLKKVPIRLNVWRVGAAEFASHASMASDCRVR